MKSLPLILPTAASVLLLVQQVRAVVGCVPERVPDVLTGSISSLLQHALAASCRQPGASQLYLLRIMIQ